MAEQKFISAANLFGWGLSFNATGKFPIIAKRVWKTYSDMINFVSDTSDVCTSGVVLTVINDEDPKLNGAYFVASCPTLDDPSIIVDVRKIGEGSGTLTIERPTFSLLDSTKIIEAENVGQVIYITENPKESDSEEAKKYTVGPYIVTAVGVLSAIGITSADDPNLGSTVETLKAAVATLNDDATTPGSVKHAIAQLNIDSYAKSDNVVSKTGYVAYSDEEKSKLSNIEEGAQVNIIEKVVFNGTEVIADALTKTITLTTPQDVVRGLADNEKILSLDTNTGKLGTALSIEYFKDAADSDKPKIRLKGQNNAQLGDAIDVSDFVKDGMLTDVELLENPSDKTGTYLRFTWNSDSSKDPVITDLNVTDLIDVYTQGDGINISNKVVSAKVKDNDEFLEVTTEGIASKGITNAITNAKNDLVGTTTDTHTSNTIYGAKKYTENALKDFKVKKVDSSLSAGLALNLNAAGVLGIDVNTSGLSATLLTPSDSADASSSPINSTNLILGNAITTDAGQLTAADQTVHKAIEDVAKQSLAYHKAAITSINGSNGISALRPADSQEINLSLDLSSVVDENSAIKVANGLLTLEWENV